MTPNAVKAFFPPNFGKNGDTKPINGTNTSLHAGNHIKPQATFPKHRFRQLFRCTILSNPITPTAMVNASTMDSASLIQVKMAQITSEFGRQA